MYSCLSVIGKICFIITSLMSVFICLIEPWLVCCTLSLTLYCSQMKFHNYWLYRVPSPPSPSILFIMYVPRLFLSLCCMYDKSWGQVLGMRLRIYCEDKYANYHTFNITLVSRPLSSSVHTCNGESYGVGDYSSTLS